MKRSLKLLAIPLIVGLLMLATTATAFAKGPPVDPEQNTPASPPSAPTENVPGFAHDVSCDGQVDALNNADTNLGEGPPPELITLMKGRLSAASCD